MPLSSLRRWAYRIAAAGAVVYAAYVVTMKLLHRPLGGPLGDLGEFTLVLIAVTAFAVGLFTDEAMRARRASDLQPTNQETR